MNDKNEKQGREEILKLVGDYCRQYHSVPEYKKGDKIPYAGRVYDENEMKNLADSMMDFWLTAGRFTEEFEKKLASYIGVRRALFVNSGSSANLLAFMTLTSPLLGTRAINRGDEVITVAAGFPTTVAPIVQYGAVPVFIDVTIPQYNADTAALKDALSPKTKAVFLAHTLGNPFDLKSVRRFCDDNGLWLIEDNCDSLGSEYLLDGKWRKTGSIGDIGTSSFYPPHHITTGEGGAVYTDNPMLAKIAASFRDWGRDCECAPGQDNKCGKRFEGQFGELPKGYDHKYVYTHFGYNLKATDMQAAIGCGQLGKIDFFTGQRRDNWDNLKKLLGRVTGRYILPEALPDSKPSWFGFLLTVREGLKREKVVKHLESKNIQTRMLFAGNIIKHPCFDEMRKTGRGYRVIGALDNTDRIMSDSFWVGVYPGMNNEMLSDMAAAINEACKA